MSIFQAKAFYNRVAYLHEGKPVDGCWQPGWYYELNEYSDNGYCINSMRGVFASEDKATKAFKREIRSRKTMLKFDKLTLEEKEELLGFTVSDTGISYDLKGAS